MKKLLLLAVVFALAACEVAPVKNVANIRTKVVLDAAITVPQGLNVAWYASNEELDRTYSDNNGAGWWRFKTGPKMQSAIELVLPSFYTSAEQLSLASKFDVLFIFTSVPTYSNGFGTYTVDLTLKVLNPAGETLYEHTNRAEDTAGIVSADAFHNVYAKAVKDSMTLFLNAQGSEKLSAMVASSGQAESRVNVRDILGEMKPTRSGSGFYVNAQGQIITAAHVVDECIIIDVQHKGVKQQARQLVTSRVLDLAVIEVDQPPAQVASLLSESAQPALGQPLFTTGYPLSAILSEYPSMTTGNLSSLGGLKGAKGHFQFTAPIQPGNSGGPIVDYKGQVLGVVTSSLNQAMMLQKTGTTTQNVNFGIDHAIVSRFLRLNNVDWHPPHKVPDLEQASKEAVDYTVQVLCYK